jgi:hypothetical protein
MSEGTKYWDGKADLYESATKGLFGGFPGVGKSLLR